MLAAISWVFSAIALTLILFFVVANLGLGVTGTVLLSMVIAGGISSLFVRPDWHAVVGVLSFIGVCVGIAVYAISSSLGDAVIPL